MSTPDLLRFPVRAGAKAPPLVQDWPKKATTDQAQLEAWRKQFPEANWAVHCRGLVVLDVDVEKGGMESLKALPRRPKTYTVKTPSGGLHLYFRGKGKNSVGAIAPGIDVRSDHGYVLAVGSRTPAGSYTVARDAPLAEAPPWLLERVSGGSEAPGPSPEALRETKLSQKDEDLAVQLAKQVLEHVEPAVEGEGGDLATLKAATRVRRCGVPEVRAPEAMADWNSRCTPPWDAAGLALKIRNAYRYPTEPFGLDHPTIAFEDAPLPALFGPADVSEASVLKTNYLVKGWLDRSSQAMLFGHWGGGKTFVALNMAAHLAAGNAWFGQRVTQGGVLLLAYEGVAAIQKRVLALRQQFPDWDWHRVPFLIQAMSRPLVSKPKLTGPTVVPPAQLEVIQALDEFEERTEMRPALVIVDPLRNALGGSDSDADLTTAYLNWATGLIHTRDCSVLSIHHPGHGDQERGRGDSALEAAMDTVIRLDKATYRLYARKQRDEAQGELFYDLKQVHLGTDADGDAVTTCVVEQVDPEGSDLSLPERTFLAALKREGGVDGQLSATQVSQVGSGLGLTKGEVGQLVTALGRKDRLTAKGKGYELTESAGE